MNEDILTTLKSIIPAISVLKPEDAIKFMDKANECLFETGYIFLLTGNGVLVVPHDWLPDPKEMFDKPMSDYSK